MFLNITFSECPFSNCCNLFRILYDFSSFRRHCTYTSTHIGREGKSGIGGRRNDLATFHGKVALRPYACYHNSSGSLYCIIARRLRYYYFLRHGVTGCVSISFCFCLNAHHISCNFEHLLEDIFQSKLYI